MLFNNYFLCSNVLNIQKGNQDILYLSLKEFIDPIVNNKIRLDN